MSLRAVALLLWCSWFVLAPGGCGGNADEFPIPEAGPSGEGGSGGDVDAASSSDGDDDPEPDAEEVEEAPPSACPVFMPVRVTNAPQHSGQPAVLWTGSGYLVVWADERSGGSDIFGTMLTPQGARMEGYGTDILIADTSRRATSPEIAPLPTAGQGYLVVFETCEGASRDACTMGAVETVVLGPDGRPTAQAPTVISPPAAEQRRPYLATGHGNVYVTYRDRLTEMGSAPRTVARLARLNAAGAQVEPVVTFDNTSDGHYPHVAVSPERVALAYQRNKPLPEIVLALLDPQLTLQREVVVRAGFDAPATNPVVQWNFQRWVLAWEDSRESDEEGIYATVATGDGSQVELPQRAYDENGNWPTIASGGLMTSLIGFYGYPGRRIFLARLEASGRLKPGQVVIDDPISAFPAVAYNAQADEYAVVYQNERLDEVMFVRFKCAD